MNISAVLDGAEEIGLEVTEASGEKCFYAYNQDKYTGWRVGDFPRKSRTESFELRALSHLSTQQERIVLGLNATGEIVVVLLRIM